MVGPKGSEIIRIPKVTDNKKVLQIPIPPAVDKEGGSFEIDLCKFYDSSVRLNKLTLLSERGRRIWLQARCLGAWRRGQRETGEGETISRCSSMPLLTTV